MVFYFFNNQTFYSQLCIEKEALESGTYFKSLFKVFYYYNTVMSRLFQVSRNERVLFISSHEGFPPLPQLPYRPNAPSQLSSHFFRALRRASRDFEIVGREGERET